MMASTLERLQGQATPPATATNTQRHNHLLVEEIQPHFNHFQFFFDSAQIRHLAKSDRRFLQRIFREKSHFNINTFFAIACEEEEDLPEKFHQIYDAILEANGSAARAYQLVVNTLTHYYSKLTWATSVHKYVIQFLVDSLLNDFHEAKYAAYRSLFELELVCLLVLFTLCYGTTTTTDCERVNEDTVAQLLSAIREMGGEEHLSNFVNVDVINHFGCSMELQLRRIVERVGLRVKAFRDPPPFLLSSAGRKRKLSLNTTESTGARGGGGRCGSSSVKGTSSEPVEESDDDTDMEEEGSEAAKAATPATTSKLVGIGTTARRHQHQRRRRRQSSVGIDAKEKEERQLQQKQQQRQLDNNDREEKAGQEAAKEGERRRPTQSPPATRLRTGSTAIAATKKGVGGQIVGQRKQKYLHTDDNTSDESNGGGSSSCSSSGGSTTPTAIGGANAMPHCSPLTTVPTMPNFPITRSATAAASGSSRSSSSTITAAATTPSTRASTRRTAAAAAGLTKFRTTKRVVVDKGQNTSAVSSNRPKPSMSSLDVRTASALSGATTTTARVGGNGRHNSFTAGRQQQTTFYALII